jgi:excisionase family DNA binding protein
LNKQSEAPEAASRLQTGRASLAAQVSPYILALGVEDACHALGIKRTKLYELVAAGKLKSFTIGGRRLFQKSELEAFVAREAANAG